MFKPHARLIQIAILLTITQACALSGEWPNLSDKMPDSSARVRVIERAAPLAAPSGEINNPTTANIPVDMNDIVTAISAAQADYASAQTAYAASTKANNSDTTAATHLWFAAQLALTRFSQTVSLLDPFITGEMTSTEKAAATMIKKRFNDSVIAERKALEQIKPATAQNHD